MTRLVTTLAVGLLIIAVVTVGVDAAASCSGDSGCGNGELCEKAVARVSHWVGGPGDPTLDTVPPDPCAGPVD